MKKTNDVKQQLDIDFNPDLFNNVFWHLKRAFNNRDIRFIWVYGGSSASKTYSVVQLIIYRMMKLKNENTLVLRKFAVDIKDSIYSDFEKIIADWELEDDFIMQQNFIMCKSTGSYVRFRGLDNSEKIKGISKFKKIIMEEISQFDEVDFKQMRKRLRGMVGQQIIAIFNPISEDHWIKTAIFDRENLIDVESDISSLQVNEKGNLIIMKTNYLDNVYIVGRWAVNPAGELVQTGGFVDQHVIDDFEKDKLHDFNYYRVYGLGEWGRIRTGGEFWKDFNASQNTAKVKWQEAFPISLSWDENVNPYLTCLVWQIHVSNGEKTAIQIDEICLPDPNNRVLNVCNEFKKRYPQSRVKGLFIYGDRTSVKEDTKLEKGQNFFTKIMQYLKDYSPNLRLQSSNPSVVQSKDFINEIYAGRIQGIEVWIGEDCKKSLFDYQYALEDSDGGLKIIKKTNPVTKVSYEEFGHATAAKRYILTTAFADEYQKYLRGGRKIAIKTGKPVHKNSY